MREPKDEALTVLLSKVDKLTVPPALIYWWSRYWSLEQRMDVAGRIKAVMKLNGWEGMPTAPHSANVEPFDYGSAKAHAIAEATGAGLNIASEGMIYRGRLWYWARQERAYRAPAADGGHYPNGKPMMEVLSRVIYAQHFGIDLKRADVIRLRDGNPNNLDPANLEHTTMQELGPINSRARFHQRREETTADRFFELTGAAGILSKQT